jgi:acyl-CoA synthetase (AMP-forming)/AMP-acid ligase II
VTLTPERVPVGALATFLDLARHGDRTAVMTATERVSYRELAVRVDAMAARLGPARRLLLLSGRNDLDTLVAYLAALRGGHPVILTGDDRDDRLRDIVATYDPDVVLTPGDDGPAMVERRVVSAHELHPDLALLLSTSGSTGSPKLVRLSHANLAANAASIAGFLDIRDSDRAPTSLPLHYSYGLSVVNSHLLRGAALVLTDLSVVDACFWDLFRAAGATSLAGVPYTFDLLDRVGFADLELPTLRYLTQAGGRLAPDRVRRYAELGQRRGFDLFVMYGQTEATARMAYLPPDLAAEHPGSIGGPVPGGSFRLRPVRGTTDPGIGELVYSGANVMLGYARSAADLTLGRTVHELRTGDLARRTETGLYEIVGRLDRHAKLFGLRIDLDRVERTLTAAGVRAACAAGDDCLVVAVEHDPARTVACDLATVRGLAARRCGLPGRAVQVCALSQLPVTGNGKVDYRAVAGLMPLADRTPAPTSEPATSTALLTLYSELLGRETVSEDDSFVSLGGDSLSYVEMSVRLEDLLGQLPAQWHTTAIRDLAPAARSRWGRALDTSVLLRALAIVLVVGTHANLLTVQGGAHLLLAVAGFNFARFQLSASTRTSRVRHLAASIGRVAAPSTVWIAGAALALGTYGIANVLFLNQVFGTDTFTPPWQYWFLETLVWTLVGALGLLAIPAVDRAERRAPFGFALTVLAATLAVRFAFVGIEATHAQLYTPWAVVWCFALGWAVARATTVPRRLLMTAVTVASVAGFFGQPGREAVVIGGVILLSWVATVRVPRLLGRAAGVLASSSLYVYLTHWQVYPHLEDRFPLLAVLVRGRHRLLAAGHPGGGPAAQTGPPALSGQQSSRASGSGSEWPVWLTFADR